MIFCFPFLPVLNNIEYTWYINLGKVNWKSSKFIHTILFGMHQPTPRNLSTAETCEQILPLSYFQTGRICPVYSTQPFPPCRLNITGEYKAKLCQEVNTEVFIWIYNRKRQAVITPIFSRWWWNPPFLKMLLLSLFSLSSSRAAALCKFVFASLLQFQTTKQYH